MKKKYLHSIFLFIVCAMTSCNDPVQHKYQKILLSHPTIISKIIPIYYSNLFQSEVRNKIKLITSLEHIGRDTVCNFLYDNQYYIALYTLSRSYDLSLQSSLLENFGESNLEYGTPFYNNDINFLGIRNRIYVNGNENNNHFNIFISFGGVGLKKNKKNDTIADYFFECKNLSIKYKANGHQELFVVTNNYKPLEIIFLKKKNDLFLIFITANKDSSVFNHTIGNSLFK